MLHNSEQPASVFALLESGSKVVPLIADGLFDLLMLKMTNIYTSKKQTKIESKGPRFEIGDFCVKLGSVTMSQNFKGVLVEVSDTSYFLSRRKGTSRKRRRKIVSFNRPLSYESLIRGDFQLFSDIFHFDPPTNRRFRLCIFNSRPRFPYKNSLTFKICFIST